MRTSPDFLRAFIFLFFFTYFLSIIQYVINNRLLTSILRMNDSLLLLILHTDLKIKDEQFIGILEILFVPSSAQDDWIKGEAFPLKV